jgi:D-arginine dehydrogenase
VSTLDFAVIGGGIAGASAACELAARGETALLEREPLAGQHTTGRSAAFVVESYGGPLVRLLTRASRAFFEAPPPGFAEHPLVHPRPVCWIARADQRERLERALVEARETGAALRAIPPEEAVARCPVLRAGSLAAALLEAGALHVDVGALLASYLRGFRRRGGRLLTRAGVTRLVRRNGVWEIEAGEHELRARVVVNAAGAWCDVVAGLAGARPIGIRPLRRTIVLFDPPAGADPSAWPCVIDADEAFYFKPEGARILASPCDEVPSEPCDAAPDDEGVALAIDRVERATTLSVRTVQRRWAGLRSFAADRLPVIGPDPAVPDFVWVAGQGGFGIMTAPGAARAAAALASEGVLPADLVAAGITAAALSPGRPALAAVG